MRYSHCESADLSSKPHAGRNTTRPHAASIATSKRLFQTVLQIDPLNANVQVNIGIGCTLFGDLESAQEAFEAALINEPDNVEAHVNYAHLLLLQGDFEAGYREHEWRLKRVIAISPISRGDADMKTSPARRSCFGASKASATRSNCPVRARRRKRGARYCRMQSDTPRVDRRHARRRCCRRSQRWRLPHLP